MPKYEMADEIAVLEMPYPERFVFEQANSNSVSESYNPYCKILLAF